MTLENKVEQFNADADIAHQIVHGSDTTTVTTEGGPVRSFAKLIKDKNDEFDAAVDGDLALTTAQAAIAVQAATDAETYRDQAGAIAVGAYIDDVTPGPTMLYSSEKTQDKFDEFPSLKDEGGVGDGVTSNTAAIAATEASSFGVITVPPGIYAMAEAATVTKEYVGNGFFKYGDTLIPMTRRSPVHSVLDASGALGNISQLQSAIRSGALTVVFIGDSVTEGVFQTSYEDSWAGLMIAELRRRLPGVVITVHNLSLGGLGIEQVASTTYAGVAEGGDLGAGFYRPPGMSQSYATSAKDVGVITGNPDLWPAGSTIGKTWRDHAKDAAPDLLILPHGHNNVDGVSSTFAAAAKSFITYARSWSKVPSIAIMTSAQPTRKQATWRGFAPGIQVSADTARSVALEMNCTLLDAARLYSFYRDGLDVVSTRKQKVNGFDGYPTGWSGTLALPSISGTATTYSVAFTAADKIFSPQAIKDGHISGVFTPAVTGQAFGLIYRRTGGGQYEAQIVGGYAVLYYNITQVQVVAITPLVGGSVNVLDVVFDGARHIVRLNGNKILDAWDYSSLVSGFIGIECDGVGTVKSFGIQVGTPREVGPPVLSDEDLLGFSSVDYWLNPVTKGGDGIHHPTHIGHYAVYFASTLGLIDAAESAAKAITSLPVVVTAAAAATTGVLALPNDYVQVKIGALALGSAAMVTGATDVIGATCFNQATITVAAAETIDVAVWKLSTTPLVTATLSFPIAGTYVVNVIGSATQNAAIIRHSIQATAIKVG